MTAEAPPDIPRRGWVLYDGSCGFCSSWVVRWEQVLRRRGFYLAALQEPWVGEWMQMSTEELELDVRLLLVSGRHLKGAEVYRYVMRRIWWAWPIYALSTLPGLRQLFDAAYRRFADNRYWISRTCHIPLPPPDAA